MTIANSTVYLGTHITDRLATLLEGITEDAGSRTNIGMRVYENQPMSNELEAPCVLLLEGDESGAERSAGLANTEIEYTVSAYVNRLTAQARNYTGDPAAERAIQGNMIADIREALESGQCPLSDLHATLTFVGLRRIHHEAGGELTGVELGYTVQFGAVDGDFCNTP